MGLLLARWIYPHFHNDHHPFAIRHQALFGFVIILSLVQVVTNAVSGNPKILGYATNISSEVIVNLTNNERVKENAPALQESTLLDRAAALKAQNMFAKDYWAHFAPDGTSPWYFFDKVDYKYSWAGENLARDFQTSSGVVAGWMASTEGHRENILNPNFTQIGVAVENGTLLGSQTTLVVQLFGRPVSYLASAPTNTQSAKSTSVNDNLVLPTGKASHTTIGKEKAVITSSGLSVGSGLNLAELVRNMSLSQKTSFSLLFVLGSLFALDSVAIFRKEHTRSNSHSGMHAVVILVLMVTLMAQSLGVIL